MEYRRRASKGPQGTGLTCKRIDQLLPDALQALSRRLEERPDLVVAGWTAVAGPRIASMSKALHFIEGVLTVAVHNSTLNAILQGPEKGRLLRALQNKFPSAQIRAIHTRIG